MKRKLIIGSTVLVMLGVAALVISLFWVSILHGMAGGDLFTRSQLNDARQQGITEGRQYRQTAIEELERQGEQSNREKEELRLIIDQRQGQIYQLNYTAETLQGTINMLNAHIAQRDSEVGQLLVEALDLTSQIETLSLQKSVLERSLNLYTEAFK